MPQTFYSHSFGCRVNHAEKEELDRQLTELGYTFTDSDPNLFIINSCSITNKAEREAKQLIYQQKRKNPETKVIVTGCAATNWLKTKTDIPEIDMIVDNQNKQYLAELIHKRFNSTVISSEARNLPSKISHSIQDDKNVVADKFLASGRMMIKIQDGCQRFCTYCIVPYLRGLPKSIPQQTIIEMVNRQGKNVQEAVLAAINTEAYGYDTKQTFVDLLKAVLDNTSVPRLSFGSIHPWSVNDQFFNFYTSYPGNERIVNFFHIPLQSGCNKILQIMKRGYTREEFVEKLAVLNGLKPHIFLATDVIVGYLEENDSDFEDTYTFLKDSPISKFHVFRYSQRQHTAGFYLAKRLKEPTPGEKQKRAQALIALSKEKYDRFLHSHLHHTFTALVLEKKHEDYHEALLDNQIPVLLKAHKKTIGTIVPVKVTSYKSGKLFATEY